MKTWWYFNVMYRMYKWWHDKLPMWVAFHILPKKIAYWATIRVGAHATTGAYSNQIVPELYYTESLQRWEQDKLKS